MGEKAVKPMTAEEFFTWHEHQEDRYELVEGVPVKMMTGASNYHDVKGCSLKIRPKLRV